MVCCLKFLIYIIAHRKAIVHSQHLKYCTQAWVCCYEHLQSHLAAGCGRSVLCTLSPPAVTFTVLPHSFFFCHTQCRLFLSVHLLSCSVYVCVSTGIPLLCFLVLLPLNIPWSQISVTWLGVVHFLACLSPQLGSVVYHLFMNHEGGEPVYKTLLTLDMCGICMINTLGECLY